MYIAELAINLLLSMAAMVILNKLEVPIKYVQKGVPLVTGNVMDYVELAIKYSLPLFYYQTFPQRKLPVMQLEVDTVFGMIYKCSFD